MGYIKIQIIIFLFLVLGITSCRSTRNDGKKDEALTVIVNNDKDNIVFLTLQISRDSLRKNNVITLLNRVNHNGILKNDPHTPVEHFNSLALEIYEKDSLIRHIIIEHPLYKQIEYTDKRNKLAKKEIVLDKAEFFIRFQMKGNTGKVKIMEKIGETPPKEIVTIKL